MVKCVCFISSNHNAPGPVIMACTGSQLLSATATSCYVCSQEYVFTYKVNEWIQIQPIICIHIFFFNEMWDCPSKKNDSIGRFSKCLYVYIQESKLAGGHRNYDSCLQNPIRDNTRLSGWFLDLKSTVCFLFSTVSQHCFLFCSDHNCSLTLTVWLLL